MNYYYKSNNWDIFNIDKTNTERSRYWKFDILLSNGFDTTKSLIDVGCGDMSFWGDLPLKNFTGIDRDCQTIATNRKKYSNYKFYCEEPHKNLYLSADIVVCFDWLNHIMNHGNYMQTLLNLSEYSNDKIFIYTWAKNPFDSFINKLIIKKPFRKNVVTDSRYQYYRNFKMYANLTIERFFKLKKTYTNDRWPYGAMYYYERNDLNE